MEWEEAIVPAIQSLPLKYCCKVLRYCNSVVLELSHIEQIHCPLPVYKTVTVNRVMIEVYVVAARYEYRILILNEVI